MTENKKLEMSSIKVNKVNADLTHVIRDKFFESFPFTRVYEMLENNNIHINRSDIKINDELCGYFYCSLYSSKSFKQFENVRLLVLWARKSINNRLELRIRIKNY